MQRYSAAVRTGTPMELTVSVATQLDDDSGDSPHGAPAPHALVHTLR